MNRRLWRRILIAAIICLSAGIFTSCDDYVWSPGGPPTGWTDTFYDQDLNGTWVLVSANGMAMTGTDCNYLQFYGNGRGKYVYWDHGQLFDENMGYWCEAPYGPYTNYQINIQYQHSSPVTMSYWFTGRYEVTMRWLTNNGYVTYVYRMTNSIP